LPLLSCHDRDLSPEIVPLWRVGVTSILALTSPGGGKSHTVRVTSILASGFGVWFHLSEGKGAPDSQRATTKGTRWCVLCPGHVVDLTPTR
jgi:hypothetical protein